MRLDGRPVMLDLGQQRHHIVAGIATWHESAYVVGALSRGRKGWHLGRKEVAKTKPEDAAPYE